MSARPSARIRRPDPRWKGSASLDLNRILSGPYAPHDSFVAPARARPQLWRTILGVVLIVAIYILFIVAGGALVYWRYGTILAGGLYVAMTSGHTPGGVLLLLYSFAGLGLGAFVTVRILHARRAGTLFGPARATIANASLVALPVIGLALLMLPLLTRLPGVEPGAAIGTFAAFLLPALAGLVIQTGAEEVAFRGYLQQQLAARFRSPLLWMILPSAIFAAGHYSPEVYGDAAIWIVVWAGLFGCLAADLTARTGNLGAAIGFHFATNTAALLLFGMAGNIDGLALWTVSISFDAGSDVSVLLASDFLSMLVSWLIARVVLRV